MRHVIKKQVIHLNTTDASSAYRLQNDASRYYYQQILPLLEKIFDELCPGNEVISLHHIEIDIGSLLHDENRGIIPHTALESHIRSQLEDQLPGIFAGAAQKPGMPKNKPGVSSKPAALHALDQWFYYMQHGVLPWSVFQTDDAWRICVLEALATDYEAVTRLSEHILQQPAVLTRIVHTHTSEFLVKLVEAVTAVKQKDLEALTEQLSVFIPGSSKITLRGIVWKEILTTTAKTNKHFATEELLRKAWLAIRSAEPVKSLSHEQIIQFLENNNRLKEIVTPLPETEIPDGKELLLKQKKDDSVISPAKKDTPTEQKTPASKRKKDKANEEASVPVNKELLPQQPIAPTPAGSENTPEIKEDVPFISKAAELLDEGIFIQNAGLILLHPFFRFLFRNTQLMKEGVFVSRNEQQKAIYLLHYIATGVVIAEEHELAMPKLLCGWPIDEPVVPVDDLSASLLAEADDLIKAAIAQWTILKSTSAQGLRETFLQRSGKMMNNNNGLLVQVEKSSIDLLLDHLPWNLSIVKLPWLSELIRVEWR